MQTEVELPVTKSVTAVALWLLKSHALPMLLPFLARSLRTEAALCCHRIVNGLTIVLEY
jgi:hypothetical protein